MTQPPTRQELEQVMAEADLLKSNADVEAALDRMADEITADLHDKLPVVYAIMNGGLAIAGQMMTRLNFPLEMGYMHATRYRGEFKGQADLQWQAMPSVPMQSLQAIYRKTLAKSFSCDFHRHRFYPSEHREELLELGHPQVSYSGNHLWPPH